MRVFVVWGRSRLGCGVTGGACSVPGAVGVPRVAQRQHSGSTVATMVARLLAPVVANVVATVVAPTRGRQEHTYWWSSSGPALPALADRVQRLTSATSSKGRLTPAGAGTTWSSAGSSMSWAAHPRRRGDDSASPGAYWARYGSPPQARGRLHDQRLVLAVLRLTPAGAGTTPDFLTAGGAWPAHPRRRGDDEAVPPEEASSSGSRPQARGRQGGVDLRVLGGRLTPAGAGTTGPPCTAGWPSAAHPRRRGDDGRSDLPGPLCNGSPPQARGRLPRRVRRPGGRRLTPAGAGTT